MNWYFEQRVDLRSPSGVISYPDPLMAQGDHLAHTWRVQVYCNEQPMDLTGYAVTGYFDRSDGKMVPVIGAAVGHVASVALPQSVYVAAGPLTGLMRAEKDGQVITLAACRWNVRRGPGDEIVDPGHVVPSLSELLTKIDVMEAQTQAAATAANNANAAATAANIAAASVDAKVESAVAPVIGDVSAVKADLSQKNGKLKKLTLVDANFLMHPQSHHTITYTVHRLDDGRFVEWSPVFTLSDSIGYLYATTSILLSNQYSDLVREHPQIRVFIYPKRDMALRVETTNSFLTWDSADGSIGVIERRFIDLQKDIPYTLDIDLTDHAYSEFYGMNGKQQGVAVFFWVRGLDHSHNPPGEYAFDVFVTDKEAERDNAIDHTDHANQADHADHADRAIQADRAMNACNAISGELVQMSGRDATVTPPVGGSQIGGIRIRFATGENDKNLNILTSRSLGPVSALRDKQFLIKCVNRNPDATTDICGRWFLTHSGVLEHDWGQDRGDIGTLGQLAEAGTSFHAVDFDAAGYADEDEFYLRINNKGAYGSQTPYSMDVDLVIYVVSKDYKANAGVVLATDLINFDPAEYVKRDELSGDYITCWGDSLTALGGWTTTLESLSGMTVYNGGTGGESARTIMARQGADVMMVNNLTIPATTDPVLVATYSGDAGIGTFLGHKVTPLLQPGAHVNPCRIAGVEGTLTWTGSSYDDTTGTWTFTRSAAGEAVAINRPTAIVTSFDRMRNKPHLMVIFMGTNGGYNDIAELIGMHRRMIEHAQCKHFLVLGLSSGTAAERKGYEDAMRAEFGRYFLSLREYLAHPIYANGEIVSCYGLDDQGLAPDPDYAYNGKTTLQEIAEGRVPHQILADVIHYTEETKTVIGRLIYQRCCELGIF